MLHAAALLGLALAATGIASAQATATATRAAEVNAFGGIAAINPDYGQKFNFGYTAGVSYNRVAPNVLAPGLELRVTGASGNTVSQSSVLAGLHFQSAPLFGAQPYMTALMGIGSIGYTYSFQTRPTEHDFVYAVGAGAEVPIRRNLRLRADILQQTWSYQPHNLTPIAVTIGLSYTVLGGNPTIR
ncbi:MAG: hypothetical protein NVSMB62_24830 [Acidobacteriaceae bacterium]